MDMSELAGDYLVDPKEGMKNLTATALWLDPQDADAWHNKGVALNLLNRAAEASVALARAEELDLAGES